MTGFEIKKILADGGVIFADLARKMGISPQHLNNVLKSKDISSGKMEEISRASGINLFSLYVSKDAKQIDLYDTDTIRTDNIDRLQKMADSLIDTQKEFIKDLQSQIELLKSEIAIYKIRLKKTEAQLEKYIDVTWKEGEEDERDDLPPDRIETV